jgi:hypothetical protein
LNYQINHICSNLPLKQQSLKEALRNCPFSFMVIWLILSSGLDITVHGINSYSNQA